MPGEMIDQKTKTAPKEKAISGSRPAFGKLASEKSARPVDWAVSACFASIGAAGTVWGLGIGRPASKTMLIVQITVLSVSFLLSMAAAVVLGFIDKEKS